MKGREPTARGASSSKKGRINSLGLVEGEWEGGGGGGGVGGGRGCGLFGELN